MATHAERFGGDLDNVPVAVDALRVGALSQGMASDVPNTDGQGVRTATCDFVDTPLGG